LTGDQKANAVDMEAAPALRAALGRLPTRLLLN
jgi:hypothetical protein